MDPADEFGSMTMNGGVHLISAAKLFDHWGPLRSTRWLEGNQMSRLLS